jgi:hypothetical protein
MSRQNFEHAGRTVSCRLVEHGPTVLVAVLQVGADTRLPAEVLDHVGVVSDDGAAHGLVAEDGRVVPVPREEKFGLPTGVRARLLHEGLDQREAAFTGGRA